MPRLLSKLELDAAPSVVFDFLADPRRAARLHPPWARVEVAEAEAPLRVGATFAGVLRLLGVGWRFRAAVTVWEPPRRFATVLLDGPLPRMRHERVVEPTPEGRTRVVDVVDWRVPAPPLGNLLVKPLLLRSLAARRQALERLEFVTAHALVPSREGSGA